MNAPLARVRRVLGLSLAALVLALAMMPVLTSTVGAERQDISATRAADADRDELTDSAERRRGTDPTNPDTDRDRLRDGDARAALVRDGHRPRVLPSCRRR